MPVRPKKVDDENRRITEAIHIAAPLLRGLLGTNSSLAVVTSDSSALVRTETHRDKPIMSLGSHACVVEPQYASLVDQVTSAVAQYKKTWNRDPRIIVLPGKVVFAAGPDYRSARKSLDHFIDALQSGSADPHTDEEAEPPRGRMHSRVVMVTGAAQGFGLGIAQGLVDEGAHVVLADLNLELATKEAESLQTKFGPGRAMAVRINVADEDSQKQALEQVLSVYGGLDLFVSNAGIARAGSITEQRMEDFDLVTSINYRGYFLGVRTVAPIMIAQHEVRPDLLFDIIEINSKSGLEGSKRNFAYAGSKFGGIGLTQSFALELIDVGIKVNSICPGNYLDGPLWSDPENGLFVQYLRAGKVPGASTVADVRASYEAKVPIHRGCLPADVVRAVLYLVEQQYETGQALPVTGGQVMVN
ncbi:MAG: SDR family NAD(P)-dependent oxidoreductase [Propionibacteriaceae bacterium]|jgi:sorbitol-6-phosphate 2-dehydrogenase|nr:SDR family NAD(P)-dependent oxidoreductase [Propionibacteriaceae bacterium]